MIQNTATSAGVRPPERIVPGKRSAKLSFAPSEGNSALVTGFDSRGQRFNGAHIANERNGEAGPSSRPAGGDPPRESASRAYGHNPIEASTSAKASQASSLMNAPKRPATLQLGHESPPRTRPALLEKPQSPIRTRRPTPIPASPLTISDDENDDADREDSRSNAVLPSPKKQVDMYDDRRLSNPVPWDDPDDSGDPCDMLSPTPSRISMQPDVAWDNEASADDEGDDDVMEIDKPEHAKLGSSPKRRKQNHPAGQAGAFGPKKRAHEYGRGEIVSHDDVVEEILADATRGKQQSLNGTAIGRAHSRMDINHGQSSMTVLKQQNQQRLAQEYPPGAIATGPQPTEAAPGPKPGKRARPSDRGTTTARTYLFENFMFGEDFLPGQHECAFDTSKTSFRFNIKFKEPDGRDRFPMSIAADDCKWVQFGKEGTIFPYFQFAAAADSLKYSQLAAFSMEAKFDTKTDAANRLRGRIIRDVEDFSTEWRRFCSQGRKKPSSSLDRRILDSSGAEAAAQEFQQDFDKHKATIQRRAKPDVPDQTSAPVQSFYAQPEPNDSTAKPTDSMALLTARAQATNLSGKKALPPATRGQQIAGRATSPLPNFNKKPGYEDTVIKAPNSHNRQSKGSQKERGDNNESDAEFQDVFEESRQKTAESQRKAPSASETANGPRKSPREGKSSKQAATSTKPRVPPQDDVQILRWPISGGPGISLFQSDLEKLDEHELLNDTLIEFGLKYSLDMMRTEGEKGAKLAQAMYLYSSFFYKRFTETRDAVKAYEKVRKWTNRVNIFEKEFLVVPINEYLHWYLAIIVNPGKILQRKPDVQSVDPSQVRRSARHKTVLEDTSDDEVIQPVKGPKDLAAQTPAPIVKESDSDGPLTEEEPDELQSSSEADGAQEAPGDSSEESGLVRMDSAEAVANGSSPAATEAGDATLQRADTAVARGATLNMDATLDEMEASENEGGSGPPAFRGILGPDTHREVNNYVRGVKDPFESANPDRFATSQKKVPVSQPTPTASTPPQKTAERGRALLAATSGLTSPKMSVAERADGDDTVIPCSQPDVEDPAEDEILIQPTTVRLLSPSGPTSPQVQRMEQTFMDMDVDPEGKRSVDGEQRMDVDDDDVIMEKWSGPNSSPSSSRLRSTGFDPSSQIDNPGQGTMVGGSGTARTPQPIRPGERTVSGPKREGRSTMNSRSSPQEIPDSEPEAGQAKDPSPPPRPKPVQAVAGEKARPRARPVTSGSSRTRSSAAPIRSSSRRPRVYDQNAPTIIFFDSLLASHGAAGTVLTKYLKLEAMDKQKELVSQLGVKWDEEDAPSKVKAMGMLNDCNVINAIVPEQPNSCDCGVYLVHYFRRFFSDPTKFFDMIIAQFQNNVPMRAQYADPGWEAEEGPRQRKYWEEIIKSRTGEWQEQRKKDEEMRVEDKQRRLAERNAPDSAGGSPAPPPAAGATDAGPGAADTSTTSAVAKMVSAAKGDAAPLLGTSSATATAAASGKDTDVVTSERRGLRPRASAPAQVSAGAAANAGQTRSTVALSGKAPAGPAQRKAAARAAKKPSEGSAGNAIVLSDSE